MLYVILLFLPNLFSQLLNNLIILCPMVCNTNCIIYYISVCIWAYFCTFYSISLVLLFICHYLTILVIEYFKFSQQCLDCWLFQWWWRKQNVPYNQEQSRFPSRKNKDKKWLLFYSHSRYFILYTVACRLNFPYVIRKINLTS